MRIRTASERKDQGFTLIELLVVVVIIGILAAIAIPVFLNQRTKAADAAAKSDLKNAATSQEAYLVDNPTGYTSSIADLTANGLVQTTGVTLTVAGTATSYCMTAKAANSAQTWVYKSNAGGLQPKTVTTCP